jgi:hypothetical protein
MNSAIQNEELPAEARSIPMVLPDRPAYRGPMRSSIQTAPNRPVFLNVKLPVWKSGAVYEDLPECPEKVPHTGRSKNIRIE